MRWAGGECFFLVLGRMHLVDGDQDEHVGGKGDWEWHKKQNGGTDQTPVP